MKLKIWPRDTYENPHHNIDCFCRALSRFSVVCHHRKRKIGFFFTKSGFQSNFSKSTSSPESIRKNNLSDSAISNNTFNVSEKKVFGNEGLKIITDDTYSFMISDDDGDIRTVCERPCPIPRSTLIAKHKGMTAAVNKLKKLLSVDFTDGVKPIRVHLNGDTTCGQATNESTGCYLISSGSDYGTAHICTFDYEKKNRILPFNEENALRIQDQLLFVHEAVHVMFYKRTTVSYNIQEQFAKAISFHISGNWGGNGTTDGDFKPVSTACDQSIFSFAKAPFLLCKYYGFDFNDYGSIFLLIDKEFEKTTKAISDSKFKNYISDVVGKDTSDAWKASQE